jgi:hypothetical protein
MVINKQKTSYRIAPKRPVVSVKKIPFYSSIYPPFTTLSSLAVVHK